MTLQQLRYLCGIVDGQFSVSRAARTLHTSQPGISKQILMLERELGADLLVRKGNRITGLTKMGGEVIVVARRMLGDAGAVKQIGAEHTHQTKGRLVIATTHVHARYVLQPVIRRFMEKYADVSLVLRQGSPTQIAEWIATGEADLGFSGNPPEPHAQVIGLPCGSLIRSVILMADHPLTREGRLTLEAIARYAILTLDRSFAGGAAVTEAFAAAGIQPNIVLSAIDADVIKSYVELGIGIAILPSVVHDPVRDPLLRALDAGHLFAPTVTHIQVRRGKYLRSYMGDFIEMVDARWDRTSVDRALHPVHDSARP
jgi:LysR family transcriptional regulator, cys regulon transcriptional activator